MGRKHITPIQQPDDTSCGPASLKRALEIFGQKRSLSTLAALCKTGKNGTTTKNMITAIQSLGYAAEVVEHATLHHLQSALRYPKNRLRAVLVTYLYDVNRKTDTPHSDSGHWAVVSSYSARNSRIILLDSSTNQKKSYEWTDFRRRWMDYDLQRKRVGKKGKRFKLVRKWQQQLMIVIARTEDDLPWFRTNTSRVFSPAKTPHAG